MGLMPRTTQDYINGRTKQWMVKTDEDNETPVKIWVLIHLKYTNTTDDEKKHQKRRDQTRTNEDETGRR